MSERRAVINSAHPLSKTRRCELLGLARSSMYYQAQPVSGEDLELMRLIDQIHLQHPFLGSRRIRDAPTSISSRLGRHRSVPTPAAPRPTVSNS